jgi:hypothetical protein
MVVTTLIPHPREFRQGSGHSTTQQFSPLCRRLFVVSATVPTMSKSISLYECTHIVQDIDFNLVPFPALTPEWPDTPGPTPPPAAPPLPVLSRADVVARTLTTYAIILLDRS